MTSPSPSASPEEQGSPLPAILVGVAILGVAAFFIFGSGGAEEATASRVDGPSANQTASDRSVGSDPSGRVRGGIGARGVDDAQGPRSARLNPVVGGVIEGNGLKLPAEAPKTPESFASKSEEIAYYEEKLTNEKEMLEKRALFLDRVNQNILNARSPEQKQVAESRGKIVQKNYDDQKEKVEALERRLAELRG
ncbi:MAG: hypothetical protein R3B09_01870 [Nannocystaceae bacterium]